MLYCNQPDRHEPRMKCGYPLPCLWHTITLDISSEPNRIIVPITSASGVKNIKKLKKIAKALSRKKRK